MPVATTSKDSDVLKKELEAILNMHIERKAKLAGLPQKLLISWKQQKRILVVLRLTYMKSEKHLKRARTF
jgi:hypothetical protein